MHIGINASVFVVKEKSGVAVLASELIRALVPLLREAGVDVTLYSPQSLSESDSKNTSVRVLSWPFFAWTHLRLAGELLLHPPDVFLDFSNFLPFTLLFTKTRSYYYLHDFSFWEYPSFYPWMNRWLFRIGDGWSRYRAHRIFVSTEAVKSQISRYASRSISKTAVLGVGVKTKLIEAQRSLKSDGDRGAEILRKQFGIHKPFFLFVGRQDPKKNLELMIQGFLELNTTGNYQLVLVGPESEYARVLQQRFTARSHGGIMPLGYVSEQDLARLYSECLGIVLASFGEGIGFPILESLLFRKPFLYSSHTDGVSIEYASYGVQCDSDSPAKIAESFQKLAEKKISQSPPLSSYREIAKKLSLLILN